MAVGATLREIGRGAARREITESVAALDGGGQARIADSAYAFHRPAARSVWPRTNDLGALDLSARSGADRVYDAGADRQG
jgi:hypothetical protein